MKAKITKEGFQAIDKGDIHIEVIPGNDRLKTPVKIKFEGTLYESVLGLIATLKEFERAFSKEQVLEVLMKVCGL